VCVFLNTLSWISRLLCVGCEGN